MRRPLILLLLCLPLLMQGLSLRHLKTNAEGFPQQVHTSVLALDDQNEPLKNLSAKDFQVSFGKGKADTLNLKVTTFEKSGQGLSILVCVDVSGSMKGQPLTGVKEALLEFIGQKRPNDEIGILAFAEDYELICDFTQDEKTLRGQIATLDVKSGDTSLYYSVDHGLELLSSGKVKNEGRFMILFSDGREDNPAQAYTLDTVIAKAVKKQLPIFTVGYTTQQSQYQQYLQRMAQETGGSHYRADNSQAISDRFQQARRQILGSYVLSYAVLDLAGEGQTESLDVTLTHSGTKEKFTEPVEVPVPSGQDPISESVEKPKGNLALILGVLAGLLAVGAGVFFWLRQKKNKRLAEQRLREEEEASERLRENLFFSDNETWRGEGDDPSDETQKWDGGGQPDPEENPEDHPPVEPEPYTPPSDHTIILRHTDSQLQMEVLVGPERGLVFKIGAGGATLGRDPSKNSIVFRDDTVSRQHARIEWRKDHYQLEDLGSANGTFVNGQKVSQVRIEDGNSFKLGTNEGRFILLEVPKKTEA